MPTVGVRDEDLRDLAHLHIALLYLMLGSFSAIKQPSLPVQSKSERRMIPCSRGLCGGCSEECDVNRRYACWGHFCVGHGTLRAWLAVVLSV